MVLANPRHERFAQELAKGKTADEAYQLAGYAPNRGNASTLKANQSVEARVTEILNRGAVRAECTVASIIEELEEARGLAKEIQQPSPMVAASMGKAKVAGLLVDKSEHTGKDGGPVEIAPTNPRELARAVLSMLRDTET
jgi:phage terminase small subunit